MNLHAWAEQRAKYSRARHGRDDRGTSLFECALIVAVAQAKGLEAARYAAAAETRPVGAAPAPEEPNRDRPAAA